MDEDVLNMDEDVLNMDEEAQDRKFTCTTWGILLFAFKYGTVGLNIPNRCRKAYFQSMKILRSIQKMLRQAVAELRDPYPRVRGNCVLCGKCCRSLILTYKEKPVYTVKEYNKLLSWDRPTYERFILDEIQTERMPLLFTCKYQIDNKCSIHESRPLICRTYPHHSIFKMGALLEDGCGYRIVEKGSFEDVLDSKIRG